MRRSLDAATERWVLFAMDWGERAVIVVFYAALVVRIAASLQLNPFNAMTLVSDGLVVLFILIRRPSKAVSTRPIDWFLSMAGTLVPLLILPGGRPLLPSIVGGLIMLSGLSMGLWAKVSLQRSFGIAPANRGVIQAGPYRLMRHPMYAGYILVYVGFFLNNPLLANLAIYLVAIGLQVARIAVEERVLSEDPAYQEMSRRVRFRLIPGVY